MNAKREPVEGIWLINGAVIVLIRWYGLIPIPKPQQERLKEMRECHAIRTYFVFLLFYWSSPRRLEMFDLVGVQKPDQKNADEPCGGKIVIRIVVGKIPSHTKATVEGWREGADANRKASNTSSAQGNGQNSLKYNLTNGTGNEPIHWIDTQLFHLFPRNFFMDHEKLNFHMNGCNLILYSDCHEMFSRARSSINLFALPSLVN